MMTEYYFMSAMTDGGRRLMMGCEKMQYFHSSQAGDVKPLILIS